MRAWLLFPTSDELGLVLVPPSTPGSSPGSSSASDPLNVRELQVTNLDTNLIWPRSKSYDGFKSSVVLHRCMVVSLISASSERLRNDQVSGTNTCMPCEQCPDCWWSALYVVSVWMLTWYVSRMVFPFDCSSRVVEAVACVVC